MQEFGIQVADSTGQKLTIYFMPLSYVDWVKYSDAGVASISDPSVSRYLLRTYVTRIVKPDNITNMSNEVDITEVTDLMPGVQSKIISTMMSKSGFDVSDDEYSSIISKLERKSRSLIGCYDYFIFLHGGLEFYIRCLELDSSTRAHIIMMLEKTTGISVRKRFDDSVSLEIPLDIVSENSKYEGKVRNDMRSGRVQRSRRQSTMPEGTESVPENVPPDLSEMISASRSALENELKMASTAKKKAFDWASDEAAISGFDTKQNKDILNIEKKPPNTSPGTER